MDTSKRSWAKSVVWRLIGVFILGGITYAFTHDWGKTTVITGVFHAVRLVLYYLHERAWERISWGKLKHPLSHLPVRPDLSRGDLERIRQLLEREKYVVKTPEYEI